MTDTQRITNEVFDRYRFFDQSHQQPHGQKCGRDLCQLYRRSYADSNGNITCGIDIPGQPLSIEEAGLGCARATIITLGIEALLGIMMLIGLYLWRAL